MWVLTDPLMFNESRDVQLLADLLRRPLSREFKPLAQKFIKNASIRVSQCETVLIHNPLVFVQQCLACGVTEEVEELVQRVLFTMSQVDDEVLQHSIVQLVFKLLDDSRDEVQLSQEDAKKLANYLVDNQFALDPVWKICQLVPFIGYANYQQVAERLLTERELTVEQMRKLIETCFENSVGEECIKLVQRIFELATEKQLQRYSLEDQYDMLKILFDSCMDYVPELLPSYVLLLYRCRQNTQIEPADLLLEFSLEQQAGTAAVLLGYAFDIKFVNEYLAEPLESYVPMQVLDGVMSADAGVLDYVVRACYYMLKQWNKLCDSQDELAKRASSKGVTSLCHHESIGQYLLKVLLQLPENLYYLARLQADQLGFDFLVEAVGCFSELPDVIGRFKTLVGDYILGQCQRAERYTIGVTQFFELQPLFTESFSSAQSQYLLGQLLRTVLAKGKDEYQMLNPALEMVVQEIFETDLGSVDGELEEAVVLNLSRCVQLMQAEFVQFIPRTFELVAERYQTSKAVYNGLLETLVMNLAKYLSRHLVDLLKYLGQEYVYFSGQIVPEQPAQNQELERQIHRVEVQMQTLGHEIAPRASLERFLAFVQQTTDSRVLGFAFQTFFGALASAEVQSDKLLRAGVYPLAFVEFGSDELADVACQKVAAVLARLTAGAFAKALTGLWAAVFYEKDEKGLGEDTEKKVETVKEHVGLAGDERLRGIGAPRAKLAGLYRVLANLAGIEQFQKLFQDRAGDAVASLANAAWEAGIGALTGCYLQMVSALAEAGALAEEPLKAALVLLLKLQGVEEARTAKLELFEPLARGLAANPPTQHMAAGFVRDLAEAGQTEALVFALRGIQKSGAEVRVGEALAGPLSEQLEARAPGASECCRLAEEIDGKPWQEIAGK